MIEDLDCEGIIPMARKVAEGTEAFVGLSLLLVGLAVGATIAATAWAVKAAARAVRG
jgi:hypothetical protein